MNQIQQFILDNNQNLFFTVPLLVWTLTLKGLALYKAAKKEDKIWFAIILVFNFLGLLEILYLFVFSKKNPLKIPASLKKLNPLNKK
jgi:hypothetical protein